MCDIKWKRVNDPDTIIHKSIGGIFNYKIIRVARAVYEVFQEYSPDAICAGGRQLPPHFKWYYLTNFKNVSSARDFVSDYDTGRVSLTPWEREPMTETK